MKMTEVSIHWFRHGLRLHDNPALLASLKDCKKFYPIFIFDGESAGTNTAGFNRMQFLLEALNDLDSQLRSIGGQLFVFKGKPHEVLRILHKEIGITRLTFEQDCEAIWNKRDEAVQSLCKELGIEMVEKISHTLWDPFKVIEVNGGMPPLTYEMFMQTSSLLGPPPRPEQNVEWDDVMLGELGDEIARKIQMYPQVPTLEELGYFRERDESCSYIGGETAALAHFQKRLKVEETAFRDCYILPNQVNLQLFGAPMSMSAYLRFGCLSVRRFYWDVQDKYFELHKGLPAPFHSLTAQLLWREFFYCMSANNPNYNKIKGNPICFDIPWTKNEQHLQAWKDGQTGYPFIDACMRQLRKEGWIHHVGRIAVACFLTRGDLWISWEEGFKVFSKYLIDADWSVNAGNWMWISSSAFERQLDCTTCVCPVSYSKRVEPTGDYIRHYVPELAAMPQDFIFEPWLAPMRVQRASKCIIGQDYPQRIVIHEEVSRTNKKAMKSIRKRLKEKTPHCRPSTTKEIRNFMRLSDACFHNIQ